MMERNRDLRRETISAVNGLPRRRQRITTLSDSPEEDTQMELQETLRLRDRERLQKKDRDRAFPKRRRVDRSPVQQRSGGSETYGENESTDSSDEEYYEQEEETRIHPQNRMSQPSPQTSSPSNNRRGLRSLRSSPVLRTAADEMIGVPIPRRARSTSAKKLHEYWNSGSGAFGKDSSHRRFSPSPATVSQIGSRGGLPSSSSAPMKKKMKSVELRTRALNSASNSRPSSVIQDDIEIEVAEALFDLMKQSQSQSQSFKKQENLDGDSTNTADEDLKRLKAESGKDENNAFSVQNEQSIKVNGETVVVDSMEEPKKEGKIEKEKFPDDPAQELVSRDAFVNKGKVGSPKESESLSCVKVNACDIQDPIVTKGDYSAIVVETKKEAKLEIDLMSPPPLPSSPERDALVDTAMDPKAMTQDVQKKSETISKNAPLAVAIRLEEEKISAISSNQLSNLDLEKHRHDILSVSDCGTLQQRGQKEQKNHTPTSLLPFPNGMSGWPVLPHPGYMPPLQAVSPLPIDGSARCSTATQLPQFKLSQPWPKRCATHQYIARNIHFHQQLITKSLCSGPTGAATLYGTKPLNLKSVSPTQKFIPGNPLLGDVQGGQNLAIISGGSRKDKSSDVAAAFNATTSSKLVLQQAPHQAPANNFLHGPGFIFPLGHDQTMVMAPANSPGPPQSVAAVGNTSLPSNSARRPSVNFSVPGGAAAVSFNYPIFPSNEAASYIAMLQNNSCPFPNSTNIAMPSLKGGPQTHAVPFFNSSLYSSPMFNVSQSQQQLSLPHALVHSASQNTSACIGSSSRKPPQGQQQTATNISDNKFPYSATAHSQQREKLLQPSHSSSKSDTQICRKSGASTADGLVPHRVKPNNGQTCSRPIEPMKSAVIPPGTMGGGAVGNKHGDPQKQGSKGSVELIPQGFAALSFGSSTPPALNFSSLAQNSAIFQMVPDMAQNGCQMAQQKNFQASEGKSPTRGGQSLNFSKSGCTDMSALSTMGTSTFDGSVRSINFLPSALIGNQPFPSSSAALASGVSVTIPSFQQHQHQQQLIQLQKHHMQQMQRTGTAHVKASTPNSMPGSLLSSSFTSNNPVFAQVSAQTDNSSFPPKWENFPRNTAQGSSQSATSTLVNVPQPRSSQGQQTHITFGNSSVSAAPFQGQQIAINSQPVSSAIIGSPSNTSTSRNAATVGKAGSTISASPSQEKEASPNGPSQKSSPACRRNVASILSTCPGQLPELKY